MILVATSDDMRALPGPGARSRLESVAPDANGIRAPPSDVSEDAEPCAAAMSFHRPRRLCPPVCRVEQARALA